MFAGVEIVATMKGRRSVVGPNVSTRTAGDADASAAKYPVIYCQSASVRSAPISSFVTARGVGTEDCACSDAAEPRASTVMAKGMRFMRSTGIRVVDLLRTRHRRSIFQPLHARSGAAGGHDEH